MRGPGGMLTVAGGKLTTYRRIALEALARLRADLGLRRIDWQPVPLPGATGLEALELREVPLRTRAALVHHYGSLAPEVLELGSDEPSLLEPIDPRGPDIAAQVDYAARREWAVTAEDVSRRRTALFHHGLTGPDVVARVEELLASAQDRDATTA